MKNIPIILFCFVSSFIFISCETPLVIPFELSENRVLFDAKVNGVSSKYMWDTGAFLTQVDCSFDNLQYLATTSYSLLGSSEDLSYYKLDEITFNNSTVVKANSKISKLSKTNKKMLDNKKIIGVLGNNIFNGYWDHISFSDSKIYLYKSKPFLLYNHSPVSFENDNIVINANINQKKMPVIFDTGAFGDFLFSDSLKTYLGTEYKEISSNSNKKIFLVKISNINFLNINKNNLWALTDGVHYQTTLSGMRGNIGVNFIKTYDWLIDYSNLEKMKSSKIYFRKNKLNMDASNTLIETIPKTGIVKVGVTENGIYILYIETNCELAKKGLAPGSLIIRINDKDYRSYTKEDLIELIYNPKDKVTYTISNNKIQTIISFTEK